MKLKLSDDPHQWRTFMLQLCVLLLLLDCWFVWRGTIHTDLWLQLLMGLVVLAFTAWLRPRWFRGAYRIGMTVSAWLGDKMGRVILTLIFVFIFVPLGWALRLAGYDPLALRKPREANSYWHPARKAGRLDQMY
jgi:hypothetical protein